MALAPPGFANELHLYLGGLKATSYSQSTYSWALEYRRPLSGHWAGSFTWLNEGHHPGRHRDGQAVQIWWHTAPSAGGARLEAGLGPYRYFDTVAAPNEQGYADAHGWGLVASVGATWDLSGSWLASLRANRVQVPGRISSTALVAGIGYRFERRGGAASRAETGGRAPASRRSELDVMMGGTVVNSFDSDADLAAGISWRMRATDHLAGSLAYLSEGSVRAGRRAGFAPQLWLEDDIAERLSVGVGLGPYLATQKPRQADGSHAPALSVLISVTASYDITPDWVGRATWNRVETHYDRDTDVVMLGLGYRF